MSDEVVVDLIEGVSYPREAPVPCPLCGRDNPTLQFTGRYSMQVSVAECAPCRLAYQSPRPSEAASEAYMNWRWASSDRYVTDSAGKRRSARRKLDHVRLVRPGVRRLLDFGAGSGVFVRACLDAGVEAVGVEQSGSAITRARDYYDVDLIEKMPAEQFEVITMWDVVEHLRDPIGVLTSLQERLAPGGALLMTTGNYENWRRLVDGPRWGLYLLDHHYYFTPASLATTARRAGFSGFRLLDVNRSFPPIGRSIRRPGWGWRAWRCYRRAMKTWPEHGDISIMLAVVEPD